MQKFNIELKENDFDTLFCGIETPLKSYDKPCGIVKRLDLVSDKGIKQGDFIGAARENRMQSTYKIYPRN